MSAVADTEVLPRGRVLVTGATGFLGGSLVGRLRDGGVTVRVLSRSSASASRLAAQGVEVVIGDVCDRDAVAAAVSDVSVVFHLAGKLFEPWESPDEYRRTHVEGTQRLVEHALGESRLERFVHCSTTGVLGRTGTRPADERAPFRPTNVYEATKAEAEQVVRAGSDRGLPAVVVRPGLVYGPGDLHLVGFFRSVIRRRFRPIGRETVWLHPVYVDDVTDAFLRSGTSPRALGECFHVAGSEPVSLERLATTIADAGGTTAPAHRIPMLAARALASGGDALPARFRHRAPLTRTRVDFLTHSRVYSVEKAERLLGFAATTDLRSGIARCVAWYREHRLLSS